MYSGNNIYIYFYNGRLYRKLVHGGLAEDAKVLWMNRIEGTRQINSVTTGEWVHIVFILLYVAQSRRG